MLSCRIELPAGFRQSDVLAFHRRDAQRISERIDGNVLHKGLTWEGRPACLTFRFDKACVAVDLAIDGTLANDGRERMERMARRMRFALDFTYAGLGLRPIREIQPLR